MPKSNKFLVCLFDVITCKSQRKDRTLSLWMFLRDRHTAVLQYDRISPMNGITIDVNTQNGLSWDEVSFGAVPGRELCAGAGG